MEHEVELNTTFWVVAVVGVVFSCGMIAPFLAWYARRYPRRYDARGVTLRSGRRFAWSELESVNAVSVREATTRITLVSNALHLQFPRLLIGFNAALFRDGAAHVQRMQHFILQQPRT